MGSKSVEDASPGLMLSGLLFGAGLTESMEG